MENQLAWMEEDQDIMQKDLLTMMRSLKEPGTYALVDPRQARKSSTSRWRCAMQHTVGTVSSLQIGAVLSQVTIEGLSLQKLFPSPANSGYFAAIYPKRSPWKDALDVGKVT